MKILALVTPTEGVTMERMRPHLAAEAKQVWALYERGLVREMYLMGEGRPGAVLILETESVDRARSELTQLPLLREGLASVDCIALAPFVSWRALFAA